MKSLLACAALVLVIAGMGCAERPRDTRSLLGEVLPPVQLDDARRTALEADLATARRNHEAAPTEENTIWYGRRLAYLGRYQEAIEVFTEGVRRFPESYRLRRHRGHRYITVRRLDDAIADLQRGAELSAGHADQVEPDGQPNSRGIPRSTDLSNLWYHLGLARYLKGDFKSAAEAWRTCLEFSRVNDDMLVATSYWLSLAAERSGDAASAAAVRSPIHADMDVIENHAYLNLLLLFKGQRTEEQVRGRADGAIDEATIGYGIGAWKLLRGDQQGADAAWRQVLAGPNWAPFGFIAAEAELARGK